jgi:hypothetical protein
MMDSSVVVISGLGMVAAIWLLASLFWFAAWQYRKSVCRDVSLEEELSPAGEAHLQEIRRIVANAGSQAISTSQ